MSQNHDDISERPFAFTAMEGIFPGSPDSESFWQRIIKAEPAPLVSLEERWGLNRSLYYDPKPGKPGAIYLDRAFCLPEIFHLRGRQIAYGQKVVRKLFQKLSKNNPLPDLSRIGLVIATCWNDDEYYKKDIDALFKKNGSAYLNETGFRYATEDKLRYIAKSVNISGPCLSIDTACASSLYGIDEAMGIILSGQAEAMIVLGLNVTVPPSLMGAMSQITALSPSGDCLPFSADASGMVPGEAACAVFLEPLDRALKAGRKVYGVLRSVGLSADGSEGSVFGPGLKGQIASYKKAYQFIDPESIDYIEAHGTATIIGDSTEIDTLNFFLRDSLKNRKKIPVGSVKSLVGHTIAAAGMVSLIKALLMIEKKQVPPHIPVTPHPGLADSCLFLPEAPYELNGGKRPIRIGVSSFGLGGSNSHMVIESMLPKTKKRSVAKKADEPDLSFEMAIIDLEVAFGGVIGADRWQACIEKSAFSYEDFPGNRFPKTFANIPQGLYFPDTITIDTKKFRTGPKLIQYIDAFQNLATFLVGKILERNPNAANSKDTGLSFCCNSGGAKGLHLSRRSLFHYYSRINATAPLTNSAAPYLRIEELSSTLASMFSGFPAYHFNLRAFHKTLSGDSDLFFNMLQTAPYLLSNHCKYLITGGGSYIKTPLDLCYPGVTGTKDGPFLIEGLGFFLMKRLKAAMDDGDKILGIIKSVAMKEKTTDFKRACALAGVKPEDVDIREVCQLKPGIPVNRHALRNAGWFLYEASGIDKLASVLLQDGNNAAIEVFSGDRPVLTVFVEKRERWRKSVDSPLLPMDISFIDKRAPDGTAPKEKMALSGVAVPLKPQDAKAGLETPHERSLYGWNKEISSTLHSYFKTQHAISNRMTASRKNRVFPEADPSSPQRRQRDLENMAVQIRKNKDHFVLTSPCFDENLNSYVAHLKVDESNSFFFDHPLDHVPGLLLLEGATQLFEIAMIDTFPNAEEDDHMLNKMDITFHNWCEKYAPVFLRLTQNKSKEIDEVSYTCQFSQGEKIICRAKMTGRKLNADLKFPRKGNRVPSVPLQDIKLIHKHSSQNVVVSSMSLDPADPDTYICDMVAPPKGHLLCNETSLFYSMLYLLEASRQCATLCAHAAGHVFYESKMTLLRIKIEVHTPPHKEEALKIKRIKPKILRIGDRFTSENHFSYIGAEREIAHCMVTALTEDEESYEMNRWKPPENRIWKR